MNTLLQSILERGAYSIVADFQRQAEITTLTRRLIISAIAKLQGPTAASELERDGLEALHHFLPASQIGALRNLVMPELRPHLLNFACSIGRGLLGIEDEFFIDDYTILRINYPYSVAVVADNTSENPGIGRVDPSTLALKSSTQQQDGLYSPQQYHKHTPPASWAHGPHKDTWTGHSQDGINLWWAISRVHEENSMIFYPGTFGKAYQADPRSLYLAQGFPLPSPNRMALHPGEMLVFNPELLHATHLNTTQFTRVALSARINPRPPRFNPRCFYAREFWHASTDIEAGHPDVIRQFPREQNFAPQEFEISEQAVPRCLPQALPTADWHDGTAWRIQLALIPSGATQVLVQLQHEQRVMLLRSKHGWRAVQDTCPHLDISLMDGHFDGDRVHCPAHGVAFEAMTGCSASEFLSLRTWKTWEDAEWLYISA